MRPPLKKKGCRFWTKLVAKALRQADRETALPSLPARSNSSVVPSAKRVGDLRTLGLDPQWGDTTALQLGVVGELVGSL